jgi:hypothetical protein
MRRSARAAALAVAALAAGAGACRGCGEPPPSDEELVRALFDGAARAAAERRVSDAVAGVSERFRGAAGWDRREVKRVIAAQVLRGEPLSVWVTGARVAVDGDRARAAVAVVAVRGGKEGSLAALLPHDGTGLLVDASLEREPEGWRVVAASHRQVPVAEALAGPGEGAR